jgi:regulator of PEP synthase PpsR (kinase-PPPase family)
MKEFNLHLVSDSTGETLESISRASLTQFPSIKVNKFAWFLTRTERQIEHVISEVRVKKGVILYTLMEDVLRNKLLQACKDIEIPCVSGIDYVIKAFSDYLNIPVETTVARQHDVTAEEYNKKIEAINYTIAHDDGNFSDINALNQADIIIVGPSRTSKSPLSVYLSHKGFKVANIPFVMRELMPDIKSLAKPLIVGLVINPERLESIRKTRMSLLGSKIDNSYTNIDQIKSEIMQARRYFTYLNCPVIDVTHKSVEETAVYVMNYYSKKNSSRTSPNAQAPLKTP